MPPKNKKNGGGQNTGDNKPRATPAQGAAVPAAETPAAVVSADEAAAAALARENMNRALIGDDPLSGQPPLVGDQDEPGSENEDEDGDASTGPTTQEEDEEKAREAEEKAREAAVKRERRRLIKAAELRGEIESLVNPDAESAFESGSIHHYNIRTRDELDLVRRLVPNLKGLEERIQAIGNDVGDLDDETMGIVAQMRHKGKTSLLTATDYEHIKLIMAIMDPEHSISVHQLFAEMHYDGFSVKRALAAMLTYAQQWALGDNPERWELTPKSFAEDIRFLATIVEVRGPNIKKILEHSKPSIVKKTATLQERYKIQQSQDLGKAAMNGKPFITLANIPAMFPMPCLLIRKTLLGLNMSLNGTFDEITLHKIFQSGSVLCFYHLLSDSAQRAVENWYHKNNNLINANKPDKQISDTEKSATACKKWAKVTTADLKSCKRFIREFHGLIGLDGKVYDTHKIFPSDIDNLRQITEEGQNSVME